MTSKTTTTHRGNDGKTYRTETTVYSDTGATKSVTRDISNRNVIFDSGPIVSVTTTDGRKK